MHRIIELFLDIRRAVFRVVFVGLKIIHVENKAASNMLKLGPCIIQIIKELKLRNYIYKEILYQKVFLISYIRRL